MIKVVCLMLLFAILLFGLPINSFALQQGDTSVAAVVGDFNVLASEVDAEFKRVAGQQKPSSDAENLIRATALQQLVRRQLIMNHLKRKSFLPNETQMKVHIDLLSEGLQKVDKTLQEHLAERQISEQKFREAVAWNLGWKKYLDKYITDANVKSYFERNRADFDGTRVHVSHILIKVGKDAAQDQWKAATEKLAGIRKQIAAREVTFAEAAMKHSQASTADSGGDIGLIERHHPMPSAFSKVAFGLKQGETSQPVQTAFGLHLIHCNKVEPGQEDWQENRDEVIVAMKEFLFEWLADKELEKLQVQYSPNVPHFKPGTTELVVGASDDRK